MTYSWEEKPCQNGHVFMWSGGSTDEVPPDGLRCMCGAVEYHHPPDLHSDSMDGVRK
jgi:hypothetical protein